MHNSLSGNAEVFKYDMKIDSQTIAKIADLARIKIKEEETEGYILEMNKILTFMEQLNELDTTGVEPLVYMGSDINAWREDEVQHELEVEDALKNAPLRKDNYFIVPNVMEK